MRYKANFSEANKFANDINEVLVLVLFKRKTKFFTIRCKPSKTKIRLFERTSLITLYEIRDAKFQINKRKEIRNNKTLITHCNSMSEKEIF